MGGFSRFPYTENEAVPAWLLVVLMSIVPIVIIFVVSLLFIPGATVPRQTPKTLVWKRKLWELHVGWLGLALSIIAAFYFTQCSKNLFGNPGRKLVNMTSKLMAYGSPCCNTLFSYNAGILQTVEDNLPTSHTCNLHTDEIGFNASYGCHGSVNKVKVIVQGNVVCCLVRVSRSNLSLDLTSNPGSVMLAYATFLPGLLSMPIA